MKDEGFSIHSISLNSNRLLHALLGFLRSLLAQSPTLVPPQVPLALKDDRAKLARMRTPALPVHAHPVRHKMRRRPQENPTELAKESRLHRMRSPAVHPVDQGIRELLGALGARPPLRAVEVATVPSEVVAVGEGGFTALVLAGPARALLRVHPPSMPREKLLALTHVRAFRERTHKAHSRRAGSSRTEGEEG